MKIGVDRGRQLGDDPGRPAGEKEFAVTLWVYEKDLVERMERTRENDLYLPGITLAENLSFTADLAEAAAGKELLAAGPPLPGHGRRDEQAIPHLAPETVVVSASKGIENDTLRTMSDVLEDVLPPRDANRLAFLSGPSFAREVAAEMPTAVVAASRNGRSPGRFRTIFNTESYFRVYTNA